MSKHGHGACRKWHSCCFGDTTSRENTFPLWSRSRFVVSSGVRPRPIVLVVDADTESRRAVINALEQTGFSGAEATSFSDAVDRLEGFAYDGLITDVRVPGGDGLDLLDAALNRYPRLKCVVTAGF